MTDLLGKDKEAAHNDLIASVQDKIAFYQDVKATFSTPHGRRVLKDLADQNFLYGSVFADTKAKVQYNAGIQDYIRRIVDLVAVADPDTYMWLMMQRANELNDDLQNEINSVRGEDV